MRKLTGMFLVIGIIISVCVPVSAYSNEVTVKEMSEFLSNMGVPSEYLTSDEEVKYLYDEFKNNNLGCSGETYTTYLVETAEGLQTTAEISEAHMKLTITPTDFYDLTTKKVSKVGVLIEYEWLNERPLLRMTDAIAVNWDSNDFIYGGYFLSQEYANINKIDDLYYSSNRTSELTQGGVGYFVHLRETYDKTNNLPANGVHGTGHFFLEPKSTLYKATKEDATLTSGFNVNYVHNEDMTGFFPLSFSYQGVMVTINTSGNCSKAAESAVMYYK